MTRLAAVLVVLVNAACIRKAGPPPVQPTALAACDDLPPPPEPKAFEVVAPPDGGRLAGCFDIVNGMRIEAEIREDRAWMAEAWARCGPRDAGAD